MVLRREPPLVRGDSHRWQKPSPLPDPVTRNLPVCGLFVAICHPLQMLSWKHSFGVVFLAHTMQHGDVNAMLSTAQFRFPCDSHAYIMPEWRRNTGNYYHRLYCKWDNYRHYYSHQSACHQHEMQLQTSNRWAHFISENLKHCSFLVHSWSLTIHISQLLKQL